MKTKTTIMFTMMSLLMASSFAQKPKPSFAVSAGISSAYYYVDGDVNSSSDFKTGLSTGVSARIPTGQHWGVEPGLFFVQKGGVENVEGMSAKTTLNYLEMPVDMYYTKRNRFFFGFGPSFAFALSGKAKLNDGSGEQSIDLKFGSNEEDDLKSLDAGLNLVGGYRFANSMFVSVNVNSSVSNLSNEPGTQFNNAYLGIRLGYMFGNKTTKEAN